MIHYLRCSFDGTRDGEEKAGTFSFLIDAETKEIAVRKMVEAVKACRKEDRMFFPPTARVYLDDLIEIRDPLDVGLIFNVEEQDMKEGLQIESVRTMPYGYESKSYEGETTAEGVCIPVLTFGRKPKGP
jgi:hypothetical protein